MEYMTTKEASKKWGISTTRITVLINQGRFPGVQRAGKSWLLPTDTPKPEDRRLNRGASAAAEKAESFSFPMFPFLPDWNESMGLGLSNQEKKLLNAEKAVLECRFRDAHSMLVPILRSPMNPAVELAALWNAGICTIALNMPHDFSKIYLRMQLLLSGDIPHREDYAILLDTLKTYVQSMGTVASNASFNTDIHYHCLPMLCMQIGFTSMSAEATKTYSADVPLLEMLLRFLEHTGAIALVENMHFYLLGIHHLRGNTEAMRKHAEAIVQIAYEQEHYFALVTFGRYFPTVLSPILERYPAPFADRFHSLSAEYATNFALFSASLSTDSVFSKLREADYPYVVGVMQELPNKTIAERLGVTEQTIKRKIGQVAEKLGLSSKKELREYLCRYL